MPGKHKNPTIAFRPSQWERMLIEERATLSGMLKKDFIAKSCIYGNIVVTGTKENIDKILDEMQIMEAVMIDIAGQFKLGNAVLSEESFAEMKQEFLALAITIVDILKGASYLYGKENRVSDMDWKAQIQKKTDSNKQ